MKPNFIIVGAQKAGTGYLMDIMQQHPDVYMYPNEIKYFCYKRNYQKGMEWYLNHFKKNKGEKAIGEKSPDYLWLNSGRNGRMNEIHKMIKKDLGDVKIIVVLRDPVRRAISAYNHHLYHRGKRINPRETFKGGINNCLSDTGHQLNKKYGILEMGLYSEYVRKYIDTFGRENVLILLMEKDIVQNPKEGLSRICNFLNVEDINFKNPYYNRKENKPSKLWILTSYYFPLLRPILRPVDFLPGYKAFPDIEVLNRLYDYYSYEYEFSSKIFDVNIDEYWKREIKY